MIDHNKSVLNLVASFLSRQKQSYFVCLEGQTEMHARQEARPMIPSEELRFNDDKDGTLFVCLSVK